MSIKKFLKDASGVSLIEIMVVMVIIMIGIIPIAAVQTGSSRDVVKSGQRTRALAIAQGQMERSRTLGFNAAASDSGAVGTYNWSTTITTQSAGLNHVAVTVTWLEGSTQRNLTLDNMLSTR